MLSAKSKAARTQGAESIVLSTRLKNLFLICFSSLFLLSLWRLCRNVILRRYPKACPERSEGTEILPYAQNATRILRLRLRMTFVCDTVTAGRREGAEQGAQS